MPHIVTPARLTGNRGPGPCKFMQTTYHMCVDISGVMRWSDTRLQALFATNRSAKSIRCFLTSELESCKKVLPIGEKCECWSDLTGCSGHPPNL